MTGGFFDRSVEVDGVRESSDEVGSLSDGGTPRRTRALDTTDE